MEVHWINQLIILGAVQGVILSAVLFKKKKVNKLASSFLILLLLMTSLVLMGRLFYETAVLQKFWAVYTFTDIVIYLFGPAIYLFTISLLKEKLPPKKLLKWHFLPASIHLLIFAPLIALCITQQITFINNTQLLLIYYGLEFFGIISLGIYSWKSLRLFQHFELTFYDRFSFPNLSSFLKSFLYFFLFLASIWMLAFVFRVSGFLNGQEAIGYYGFWTLAAFSTYLLSYKVLMNPEVLEEQFVTLFQEQMKPTTTEYDVIEQEDKKRLALLLERSKIYKNPKLSLEELAQAMELSRHELSRIINQGFDKTFFDLINSYRIQEFIALYHTSKQQTFLEVAYAVGFNSKSAFNRAFRKATGTNPSNYFKNQQWQNDPPVRV